MRRTWVAYVVRREGDRTELLTYQVADGDDPEGDDLPAGRIPFGRTVEAAIALGLEKQTGLRAAQVVGELSAPTVRDGREWRGYLVEAPAGLPDSWSHDAPLRGGRTLRVTVRWRDLGAPRPLWREKAQWLGEVRRRRGVEPPPGIRLRAEPAESPANEGFMRRHWAASAGCRDLTPTREDLGFEIEIPADRSRRESARSMLIQTAGRNGYRVTDLTGGVVYPPGHSPARVEGLRIDPNTLDELAFDAPLVRELARLEGPLMPYPMRPPVGESGVRDDRDEEDELPSGLWRSPANQRLVQELDGSVFAHLYDNDGLLLSANAPTEGLERLSASRVEERDGVTWTHAYESRPEWPAVLAEIGWVFVPNGPDGVWGELRASPSRLDVLDNVRAWCRANARTWAERREVEGEIRRVWMPERVPRDQPGSSHPSPS